MQVGIVGVWKTTKGQLFIVALWIYDVIKYINVYSIAVHTTTASVLARSRSRQSISLGDCENNMNNRWIFPS